MSSKTAKNLLAMPVSERPAGAAGALISIRTRKEP